MDKRIELYKKNLKEKKYLLNENLEYLSEGVQGEVFRIGKLGVIVKKINYEYHKEWIPILNRKNVYNDSVIGMEIKASEKITKYMIKHKIPFYPLFYGFEVIVNKMNENKSEICLYYEDIEYNTTLITKLNQIKNFKTFENIIIRLLIAVYVLNKKLGIIHHDLHFGNILITKYKNLNKYDIFKINDRTIYIPNIGYKVTIIDFGRSGFSRDSSKSECYFLKYNRVNSIMSKLYTKNKKELKQIIRNNNIKEIKNKRKFFDVRVIDRAYNPRTIPHNSQKKNLLFLIASHLMKYHTDLKEISISPHYSKIFKKLEKTSKLCSKDMLKWIFINFPTYFEKPSKIIISETYNI
jgi:thiamine kinase-like enzyme